MTTLTLSLEAIGQVPIEGLTAWAPGPGYLLRPPGQEHYRLLAYLSTQFERATFCDIGTGGGHSALALSFSPANRVVSFDVANCRSLSREESLTNVEFLLGECLQHPAL